MTVDRKQAMHVDACKSFSTAEANENERRWNEDKIHIPEHTRSLSGSLLGYKTIP